LRGLPLTQNLVDMVRRPIDLLGGLLDSLLRMVGSNLGLLGGDLRLLRVGLSAIGLDVRLLGLDLRLTDLLSRWSTSRGTDREGNQASAQERSSHLGAKASTARRSGSASLSTLTGRIQTWVAPAL
jgi:hypothetical protein